MNDLEKIFSQHPQSPIFTILADLYYKNRSYKNAARVCQIGLKYDSKSVPGQYMLAKLLLVKDDPLNAEKTLKNILVIEPQHLNALLLLVAVMGKLNKSFKTIIPYIKQSAQLYPSNPQIQRCYTKYCITTAVGKKNHKKITKKSKERSDFILNPKLATKTLYRLFCSQKKYSDAYNVLMIMQNKKTNITFVSNEIKKIENKV